MVRAYSAAKSQYDNYYSFVYKNKTISSNSHPSATANKAKHILKMGCL